MRKLNKNFMRLAIQEARKNLKLKNSDGGPFGACIVKDGKVLAVARNTVLKHDATCHAEVNAIRAASRVTGSFDLSGATIYSTTEPCPMCFAAIHWARIGTIVYGTTISDAARIGFNEMRIGNRRLKGLGKIKVKLVPGYQRAECVELFAEWDSMPGKTLY